MVESCTIVLIVLIGFCGLSVMLDVWSYAPVSSRPPLIRAPSRRCVGFSQMCITASTWQVNAPTVGTNGGATGISIMNGRNWTPSAPASVDGFDFMYSSGYTDDAIYLTPLVFTTSTLLSTVRPTCMTIAQTLGQLSTSRHHRAATHYTVS